MQHLESAAVWSVMAVTYVIADLSYTTKFPKTYVWEHRGKGGTEKEGEKGSRVRWCLRYRFCEVVFFLEGSNSANERAKTLI